jgi:hypothetical protein
MVNQLIQWIIMNQHPFTLAEESNFIKFVHSLNPNAMIPSADTIKRKIISLHEINFQKIQTILQTTSGLISFTTDIWTSPSTKAFISLTAHFIDTKWNLRNLIVDFKQICGSHTGINIKNAFVLSLESLSLQNKVTKKCTDIYIFKRN